VNEPRRHPRRKVAGLAFALLALVLSGCGQDLTTSGANGAEGQSTPAAPSTFHETPAPHHSTKAAPQAPRTTKPEHTPSGTSRTNTSQSNKSHGLSVTVALDKIPTKGRAPKTGYARDEFGSGWKDPDHNGCDTRNDILNRDLTRTTHRAGTHECMVMTGSLADPYTGTTIAFQRGQSTSTKVQIDHVVALSNAWQTGAQKLSADDRLLLANDPMNLLAVDGPANASKSDGDAATWLPPTKAYRCSYVARQTAVKLKYGLWMTSAEKSAITRVVKSCPGQTIPAK
jgi:hypothetical protein